MVLIALAIVFGGLGAMSLSKSDSDGSEPSSTSSSAVAAAPQAPTKTSAPAAPAPPTTPAGAAPTSAPVTSTAAPSLPPTTTSTAAAVNHSVPVRVLNNSMIAGLAAKTASELGADGWTNVSTGNFPGENIPKTTVYYGNSPGEKEAALAIASELGASAEPKGSGFTDQSGVVVIVTGN